MKQLSKTCWTAVNGVEADRLANTVNLVISDTIFEMDGLSCASTEVRADYSHTDYPVYGEDDSAKIEERGWG